jgi:hypothetical protein
LAVGGREFSILSFQFSVFSFEDGGGFVEAYCFASMDKVLGPATMGPKTKTIQDLNSGN